MPKVRPNILLITTDQHNASVLGCYGNPVVKTPNLNGLASEGILFRAAYTLTPLCTPARTTILTGQHACRHGVLYNININETKPDPPDWTGLPPDAVAFPEILSRAGYQTALFGKLHSLQRRKNFGLHTLKLAEGKGHFVTRSGEPDDYRRYLREKGYPDSHWRTWENPDYQQNGCTTSPLPAEDYIDYWTATEAISYLDKVREPFFAWVSFSGPHTPWDPPEPYGRMYDPEDIPMPARRRGELEEKHPAWVDHIAKTIPALPRGSIDPDAPGGLENAYRRFPDPQVRRMLAAYYGQITLIDDQVGRIIAALQDRECLDNTLIMFTADHGDYLGDNWAFYKHGAFYDSLARVPMILRWPAAGIDRHRTTDHLVSLIDIAPTFLDAAAIPPVDHADGLSLLPLLRGDAPGSRSSLFVDAGHVKGLISSEWKYMRWNDGFEELYARENDPHDLYNVAEKTEGAAPREQCRSQFNELLAESCTYNS